MYQTTTAVNKILELKKRIRVIQGGSSAGKTIAIMLILIDIAQTYEGIKISVMSETMPHLKKGAMRDFLDIMKTQGYYNEDRWNRTDKIYEFETKSFIEFFSADDPEKVKGPRRDILFINECNNISYETYTQAAIRTNNIVFLDFNPVAEFWVHTELVGGEDTDFIILTYKDNEALSQSIINEIEKRKDNKYFWQVYGKGQIGEIEGKIYKNWQIIPEVPVGARLIGYGLDFGYSNDPTVILAIYYLDGRYILDEVVYKKGLSNKAISDILNSREPARVTADSAEPKSIDEIFDYGVDIVGAVKGPGSVNRGIQYVQTLDISITAKSIDTIKGYRNFMFSKDKNGNYTNVPDDRVHEWSNPMDAARYGLEALNPNLGKFEKAPDNDNSVLQSINAGLLNKRF